MINTTSEQYFQIGKGTLQAQACAAGTAAVCPQANCFAEPGTCLPPVAHTDSLKYCAINQRLSAKQKTVSRLHTAATSSP